MTALFIFFQLQEARTVVILHLPLPFSLVYLEFPCAWPTVSDSLTTSRYVQEASGVPAATEGSIFPLLSAATLQLRLEHSAWFIKTDIPWTIQVRGRLSVAFVKTRSGITFTEDSFVLRHSGKTHRNFGLLTDLLIALFLVRKSQSLGCRRHHSSKFKWLTGQLCTSPLRARKGGAKMCIEELDYCVG